MVVNTSVKVSLLPSVLPMMAGRVSDDVSGVAVSGEAVAYSITTQNCLYAIHISKYIFT